MERGLLLIKRMLHSHFLILAMAILTAFGGAFAHAGDPLRDPEKLYQAQKERMVRLANARVVHADYARLRLDFPRLSSLSEAEIDELLIRYTAFISVAQTSQEVVNTKIPTLQEFLYAFRPMGYGRAVVFSFLDGLIDSKGSGSHALPRQASHKNGLMSLAEALREFLFERALHMILRHAGYAPGTVASYAAVDLGFDVVYADGFRERAGAILRQAAQRDNPVGSTDLQTRNAIESILRRYGITSDHELVQYEWMTIDRNNIQITSSKAVFDFGAMRILRQFQNSPVHPDPALRLPAETWGLQTETLGSIDLPELWAKRIAQGFVDGTLSRADIRAEFEQWLKPLERLYFPCEAAAK